MQVVEPLLLGKLRRPSFRRSLLAPTEHRARRARIDRGFRPAAQFRILTRCPCCSAFLYGDTFPIRIFLRWDSGSHDCNQAQRPVRRISGRHTAGSEADPLCSTAEHSRTHSLPGLLGMPLDLVPKNLSDQPNAKKVERTKSSPAYHDLSRRAILLNLQDSSFSDFVTVGNPNWNGRHIPLQRVAFWNFHIESSAGL